MTGKIEPRNSLLAQKKSVKGRGGRCGGQTEEGSTHFVGISGETRRERTIIEEEIKEFSPPLEFCKVPQGAFYTKT